MSYDTDFYTLVLTKVTLSPETLRPCDPAALTPAGFPALPPGTLLFLNDTRHTDFVALLPAPTDKYPTGLVFTVSSKVYVQANYTTSLAVIQPAELISKLDRYNNMELAAWLRAIQASYLLSSAGFKGA